MCPACRSVGGFPEGSIRGWEDEEGGQVWRAESPSDLGVPWRVWSVCGHRCGWHWAAVEQRVPSSLTSRCALARNCVLRLFCLRGHRPTECVMTSFLQVVFDWLRKLNSSCSFHSLPKYGPYSLVVYVCLCELCSLDALKSEGKELFLPAPWSISGKCLTEPTWEYSRRISVKFRASHRVGDRQQKHCFPEWH